MLFAASRQPYCFEVNEGKLFAFAGLWDRWKNPNGEWIRSCSILTTTPNAVTVPVHDRMPVILNPSDYDLWLDPGMNDSAALTDILKPFAVEAMRSYPVSSQINSANNDREESGRPIQLSADQAQLFKN
jgi:putative SOS response-associated peptidase YedK